MAEINAKDLTAKTSPASTDSMLLFGTTSNEGAKITVDNLADNILSRLTTKTFTNQVGGSSAATILAQLATLNSNISYSHTQVTTEYKNAPIDFFKFGRVVVIQSFADMLPLPQGFATLCEVPEGYRPSLSFVYGYSANYNGYRYYRIENDKDLIVYNPTATNTTNGGFVFVYMV